MTEQGTFTVDARDGIPLVEVAGDVDITNIKQFQEAVHSAADGSAVGIVTSLRKVGYLDSRMVHELFVLGKRFAQNRRVFALVLPESRSARYILETAGVTKANQCYASIEEAVESVKSSVKDRA